MNKRVGIFKKVSESQWKKDAEKFGCKAKHEDILLPVRKTVGSAGYDFIVCSEVNIGAKATVTIPTGVRCEMDDDFVLMLFPRSGLGFKYGVHLENTVGIIDSDYAGADNEGHIMVKLTNPSSEVIHLKPGDGFCQGIFLPFGITRDDAAEGKRTGGFGSTDTKVNEAKIMEPPVEK